MKITLVRAPFVAPLSQKRGASDTPPLGLAYLAGQLKRLGHEVICIDGFGEAIDHTEAFGVPGLELVGLNKFEIAKRIPVDSKIIGISCMFTNEWIYCKEILAEIRAQFPSALLVLGGEHPTADPDFCFTDSEAIDLVVMGEGELTLAEIVKAHEAGTGFSSVQGVVFRKDGALVHTTRRARIVDLDSIAWPDWTSIPLEKYLAAGRGNSVRGKRAMPILASRGCPYSCTFCSNPVMWGNRWYVRSVEDVIAELKFYIDEYDIEHFDFLDLTAIIREDWIVAFSQRLLDEGIKLTWAFPSGTRSEALTAVALPLMKRAGCLKLNYAPESGSATTLKRIKKRVRLSKMLESINNAIKIGIVTRVHLIIGLPGQTRREMLENYQFAFRLAVMGVHDLIPFAFSPYPGSELHDQLVAAGKLRKKSGSYTLMMASNVPNNPSGGHSWSEFFSARQITLIIFSISALFYSVQFALRPWRALLMVKRLLTSTEITTLELILSNYLSRKLRFMKT